MSAGDELRDELRRTLAEALGTTFLPDHDDRVVELVRRALVQAGRVRATDRGDDPT